MFTLLPCPEIRGSFKSESVKTLYAQPVIKGSLYKTIDPNSFCKGRFLNSSGVKWPFNNSVLLRKPNALTRFDSESGV